MAKKNKEQKEVSKPQETSGGLLEKKWHNIPVIAIGVIALLLLTGIVAALLIANSSNEVDNSGQITDEALYTPEEREAVEAAQLDDSVDEALRLQAEGDTEGAQEILNERINSSTNPDEAADATFDLGLNQWYAGDLAGAINTLTSIESLDSGISLFLLYSTIAAIAVEAEDGANAVRYSELTLEVMQPETFEYDWEYESYIEAYEDLLEVARTL